MKKSIWTDTAKMPQFGKLSGSKKTDVLIIGGGMAGLLCAYGLEKAGAKCIVLEADRIMGGVSAGTTAKITSQHSLVYSRIADTYGIDTAGLYLEANEKALARYREMANEIDCGFEEKPSFVYSIDKPDRLEKEMLTLMSLRFPAEFADNLPLPFKTVGAVKFHHQAQFHPLRFGAHIAKELEIYEQSPVREVIGQTAYTDDGNVSAEAIIIATHFPIINRHGLYFMKLYQSRSYSMAISNVPDIGGMFVDENDKGMSFRNYEGSLIMCQDSHRTGKDSSGWGTLYAFKEKTYPDCNITHQWSSQDCMSLDGIPYIGRYSKRTPHIFVATGFNKWGMTSSMVSAMILSDMITGRKSPYEAVFSPSRSIMHKQLMINGLESTVNMLTPTAPRCPHLGCALKWNKHEHSWDCPCHGSRFEDSGKLIQNPSLRDMKRKSKQ